MGDLFLEDFAPGDLFTSASVTVTESQIIDFARRFDPQPIHLDAEAAGRGAFGGLVASGLHTYCLTFRLFVQSGILAACEPIGAAMDKARFHRPVRPGDTLSAVAEVLAIRPSRSKRDRGTLVLRHSARNQRGETVFSVECTHIVKRGGAAGA